MVEIEYMSKDLCNKLEAVCNITKYLLMSDNIMFSSGYDGYDSVSNMYCFFQGNLLNYKEYKISADIVKNENEITIASILADIIGK